MQIKRQRQQEMKCSTQSSTCKTDWDKYRFADLKKRFENNYVSNKAEYPTTVTVVQILLLNYQPNYCSNTKSQSNGIINQLMFANRGKTGDDEGESEYMKQKPQINLDHITCNDFVENGNYVRNNE